MHYTERPSDHRMRHVHEKGVPTHSPDGPHSIKGPAFVSVVTDIECICHNTELEGVGDDIEMFCKVRGSTVLSLISFTLSILLQEKYKYSAANINCMFTFGPIFH